jgi:hypothetical protein
MECSLCSLCYVYLGLRFFLLRETLCYEEIRKVENLLYPLALNGVYPDKCFSWFTLLYSVKCWESTWRLVEATYSPLYATKFHFKTSFKTSKKYKWMGGVLSMIVIFKHCPALKFPEPPWDSPSPLFSECRFDNFLYQHSVLSASKQYWPIVPLQSGALPVAYFTVLWLHKVPIPHTAVRGKIWQQCYNSRTPTLGLATLPSTRARIIISRRTVLPGLQESVNAMYETHTTLHGVELRLSRGPTLSGPIKELLWCWIIES